jgi:hypothetical protein
VLPIAISAVLVAGVAAVSTGAPSPAAAADSCTTPQLTDVSVSQGLPTYGRLTPGKSTLVRLYLATPACLPIGASVAVTGATLTASTGGAPIDLTGSLPLPPLGPPSTAPVPASASDVQFLVPGSYIEPVSNSVSFAITVRYRVTTPTAPSLNDAVTFATMPGTTTPIGGSVAPAALPAGLLVVPMGDLAKGASTQFPQAAQTALQVGMTSLTRVLPVADSGGLVWKLNGGLLNLGAHTENGVAKNYLSTGTLCADGTEMEYVGAQLEALRVAWNSVSTNAKAQRALGQVWQGISLGATTNAGSSCAEGYAQVNGAAAWGRTVASSLQGASVTGTIAAMEYAHTAGAVAANDPRYNGYHSTSVTADVTAPGRAYNLYAREFLPLNRTAMRFFVSDWNDNTSLYEKQDWDWLQCAVSPPTPATGSCRKPGELAYAGAAPVGSGTFEVTGSTDGSVAGTDAYSYTSTDNRIDPTDPTSDYHVVQRSSANAVLRDDSIAVHSNVEGHVGATVASATVRASFGAAVPANPSATRVELWRGKPGATGSALLYSRPRDNAPTFVAAQAQGHSVSVSATDERPADLRLDLFVSCPDGNTSPLATGVKPTNIADKVAVFAQDYDTSLACPSGQLLYRVSDGFLATTQTDVTSTTAPTVGTAAIYAPTAGAAPTAYHLLQLSGSARDALDKPVTDLRWSLTGPSFPIAPQTAVGQSASLSPPVGGYQPGVYTLSLRAFSPSGSEIASTTRTFTVVADADGDAIPDTAELQSCYAANAVTDPSNALQDSDNDGVANVMDEQPCTTSNNVSVQFNPTSYYKASSGNNVKMTLYNSKVDLTTLRQADIFITNIAGYATANLTGSATTLPATSWVVTSPTTATATFDRATTAQVLSSRPSLLGYIPIFIGTLDQRLHGTDAAAPNVFP